MRHKRLCGTLSAALLLHTFAMPILGQDETPVTMYRLYNPNSGEHFYTGSAGEKNHLVSVGWNYEGTGWVAPKSSDHPVYRLYNPNAGDHHYTMSKGEHDSLTRGGWRSEGIGWYSDDSQRVKMLRQYNPNAKTGTHNYTTAESEKNWLVSLGWKDEGIGWYAIEPGKPEVPAAKPNQDVPSLDEFAGSYKIDVYKNTGNLTIVFGTMLKYGNSLTLNRDGSYKWEAGGGSDSGKVRPVSGGFEMTNSSFWTQEAGGRFRVYREGNTKYLLMKVRDFDKSFDVYWKKN